MKRFLQVVVFVLGGSVSLAQSGLDDALKKVGDRINDAIDQAMIPLENTLMLNGTESASTLRSSLFDFKATLVSRFKGDVKKVWKEYSVLKEFAASDESGIDDVTKDEKMYLTESIQKTWTDSYNDEIKKWGATNLRRWADHSRNIWNGIEDKVEKRLKRAQTMLQGQNQCALYRRGIDDHHQQLSLKTSLSILPPQKHVSWATKAYNLFVWPMMVSYVVMLLGIFFPPLFLPGAIITATTSSIVQGAALWDDISHWMQS